jgi:hypothetical protein
MGQNDRAFQSALSAAEKLPPKLQKQLTERLLATTLADENMTAVYLKRLSLQKQTRLAVLMDKINDGLLSHEEKFELEQLGAEADKLLLENSYTLAKALRPELFDKQGRPIKSHFASGWPL